MRNDKFITPDSFFPMKTSFAVTASIATALLLSACGSAGAPPPPDHVQRDDNQRGMMRINLQKYADEANAAADKTTLTKDQFIAEMQTIMAAERLKFPQQNSGAMMRGPRGNSGSMMRGQRGGSGSMMINRLESATSFYKYTDPSGAEAIIALDTDGNVIMKFPHAFGQRGGSGAMMRTRTNDDNTGAGESASDSGTASDGRE